MKYETFKQILNQTIFEKSKAALLGKIAMNPERYTGLFRPTKPVGKLLQNLLQSHEIRFGDAIEAILEEYIRLFGGEPLGNGFQTDEGEKLDVDQIFRMGDHVFFVEQKVRDDHDSTKKRGQINNFQKKLAVISKKYGASSVTGIFYFVDPEFNKNRNYYASEIEQLCRYHQADLKLFYGKEFFEYLGHGEAWEEFQKYLPMWKEEIPDLPLINFDLDPESTFEEIKDLNPAYFRTLFSDEKLFNEIVLTIFPEKLTLKKLAAYFSELAYRDPIYATLYKLLSKKLQ